VAEAGVGEGAFAHGFLQELQALDEKSGTDIAARTHYTLLDFSQPMLKKAKAGLEKGGFGSQIEAYEWDATGDEPPLPYASHDLIRCNELLSDLPSNAYARVGEQLMEARYDEKMKPHLVLGEWQGLNDLERKLMLALPEKYILPINRTALQAALALAGSLNAGGKLDVFDYGFYLAADFDLPPKMWNDTLVREFNGQWTVDLNFLYLSAAMAAEGLNSRVELQEEYASAWKGKNEGKRAAEGLDYEEEEDGVKEDDFFYHLRVQKP
jgi:SAM-dependent MidA family methyltransferase